MWLESTGEWISNGIYSTFIVDGRWVWFLNGIKNTLLISLFSVLLGMILGLVTALFRLSNSKVLKAIGGTYVDVIRGTPTMVQLLIIYYVIFAPIPIPKMLVGIIAFGINSGAYIAEIVRGGILSVNKGQTEAGRSLGLTNAQTMTFIIIPQAVKNILPALANEFIVLIKETAVIGMVDNLDLVGAAKKVQSRTYDYFWPLISIAIIYYVVIKFLSVLLNRFEAKLRKSDVR
ncbi:MAG: amino acid ABC transporter permease [Eubacteriales bacterium]|nr:amino acid ABC transporter permease [Eubacteriales bacterium]